MKAELIQDYLQRAEMAEAQSAALSHILGEMATRSEILQLEDRVPSYEKRLDTRFAAFEEMMDQRFAVFEEKIDERMDRKLEALETEMTWKIFAIVTFIVSVSTALNIFLG